MAAKAKASAVIVKQQIARLMGQIETMRKQAQEQGRTFLSLDERQLAKKLRAGLPFFTSGHFTSGAKPGNTAYYEVVVHNPTPSIWTPVFLTIFFGLGRFLDIGHAWVGRDNRWPAFSSSPTVLAPNSDRPFSVSYTVPAGLPLATYNGNAVIWVAPFSFDAGAAFDRSGFHVTLV